MLEWGLPVPLDGPTLRDLASKVAAGGAILTCMDLENRGGIFRPVARETGAGILLYLHNLAVNEINLGWAADEFLAELDLTRVVEIHVVGVDMLGRWYTRLSRFRRRGLPHLPRQAG
jgi:hypothetical protein